MMAAGILPDRSGYRPLYTSGTACPGCGKSHWTIGRSSAECVFCGTALPLVGPAGATELARS